MRAIGLLLALAIAVPASAQNRTAASAAGARRSGSGNAVVGGSAVAAPVSTLGAGMSAAPSLVPSALPAVAAPAVQPNPAAVLLDPGAPESAAPALVEPGAPRGPPSLQQQLAPVPESLAAPDPKTSASALKDEADADFSRRIGEGERKLNVLMVGAEAVPYIKTGGLADVVDAVSRGLVDRGHRVTLVLPKYHQIDAEKHGFMPTDIRFGVPVAGRVEPARLWAAKRDGVDVYLIENDSLHSPKGAYAPRLPGTTDDDERFIFYARAALEAARALGFQPDVIHTHDWHAALIPPLLKLVYRGDPFFAGAKTISTIHNIAYQGMFGFQSLLSAGFSPSDFTYDKLEYWGHFNFLKAGLTYADALTTVSPTYARQIQESNEFGRGMEGLLRFRAADLSGILNGVDPALWDPATDEQAPVRYGVSDVTRGKAAAKAALQAQAKLAIDPKAPIFSVASRFDHQKGLDLVADAIPGLVERGAQVIVSGSGDQDLADRFHELARRYPGRVYVHPFSESFVHSIYAGSDFVLMPSRFEPCGLTQLISQRYGTLPVVTRTGGLADTITDVGEDAARGDGFFMRDFSAAGLLEAADRALALSRDAAAFQRHRRIAMRKDSSWARAIEQYERLFFRLLD